MPVKRKSAYIQAAQEAQLHRETAIQPQSEPVTPLQGATVPQQDSKPVEQAHSATVKKDKKVTFYLTQDEEEKLQDLEYQLSKRHKKRINRNDIVRYLIDNVTADDLGNLA